ncbi:DUF6572 domain-containing protein [Dickeya zeae]|uniref:DUF6572 domain-containing protein n=1 Tax=Dickeya zeae TaxID=204042 RepID=UPI001268BE66|nr:DUF6572 domain-containing protein [Dickeya zeae]
MMSIDDVNKIDSIGVLKDHPDIVSLAISDHLPWKKPVEQHLFKLQEKINTYIKFIDSGEIYEKFPDAKGMDKCVIEIFFKHEIPPQAICFLESVREILSSIKVSLKYKAIK